MCINERRAVCSVLRVVHVHVRDGVHVVHRIVLKLDIVVRKVVRNVVAIYTYLTKSFVREHEVQGLSPLHPPSVNVDCRQQKPISR